MKDDGEKIEGIRANLRKRCLSMAETVHNGCERVFDEYFCWPETEAGKLASQSCSNKFVKSTKDGFATKQCLDNGTWLVLYENDHWTNLTQCGNVNFYDLEAMEKMNTTIKTRNTWLKYVRYFTFTGYGVSLISLVTAFALFVALKQLHCERNKLHMNVFASYILRAAVYLIKESLFHNGIALAGDITFTENGKIYQINYTWTCKMFVSIHCYCVLSNFIFLLMEGLYLHNLIFLNLFSESHGTNTYCILGWSLPFFFVIPWMILRLIFEDTGCWTRKDDQYIHLLIDVPSYVTVLINLALFKIIVKVLVMKLQFTSTFTHQRRMKYVKKLMKSTLILIPLYGVPFVFSVILSLYINITQSENIILELVWILADQTFMSFLGLFAALVYCLLNSDVHKEIIRKYTAVVDQTDKEFRRSRTISSNTQQYFLHNQDDALENLKLFGIVDDDSAKNKGLNGHSIM
ncbi:secretin receptor-like isoform X2 [Euwallacea fornicatus]|uniref:secretin receptor-like isoform X2 n=1 Tax=Euwallacea fornicatus TaxID=995702 RepID=UPI00338D6DB4